MQPSRVSVDRTSPLEQFIGRKIDATRDLRIQFGDYVQATDSDTDNTMCSRTQGCTALLPTGYLGGSIKMLHLATDTVITRDQFKILPMPDLVFMHIISLAASQGYLRGNDQPDLGHFEVDDRNMQHAVPLPDMMAIDERNRFVQLADHLVLAPDAEVNDLHVWVRLCNEASYLLAAEAQRKDWLMEVVSEDVFTYNDQVVKQLAMISEKKTIKEAKQSIHCA